MAKMKRINQYLIYLILIGILLLAVRFLFDYHHPNSSEVVAEAQNPRPDFIPTIEDIQRWVGCEKIDGKLSPDWRKSETQIKWDLALNQQDADRYNHYYENK